MKMRIYRNVLGCLFIASILSVIGCSDDDKKTSTLYDRLGGVDAISAVVDKFLTNVASDNTINARFGPTVSNASRLQLLRNNLIDQICEGTGGPCKYKGKTMLQTHAGMNISTAEFNALVGDLVAAVDFYKVPEKEKTELLAVLGPMQTDIVGK
jgi:hemoglobin